MQQMKFKLSWNSRAKRELPEAINLETLRFRTISVGLKTIQKPGFRPLPN